MITTIVAKARLVAKSYIVPFVILIIRILAGKPEGVFQEAVARVTREVALSVLDLNEAVMKES